MLANGSLDVGKMLGKPPEKVDITGGIECEPHRNRTCNLLIKRLKMLLAALFNK